MPTLLNPIHTNESIVYLICPFSRFIPGRGSLKQRPLTTLLLPHCK
jgi:hypothetical protein